MTVSRILMTSTALALAAAAPAYADLTAEQVLADQLKQMESYGMEAQVTGQSRSGDTLTVDGLTATLELPEGDMQMEIGGAYFRELGDGTVEITYPDVIPITLAGTSPDGEAFEMEMSLSQTNTRTLVSGIPEEIRYEFSADAVTLGDFNFVAPADAAEVEMDVSLEMTGLSGVMEITGGGTVRDYTSTFAFDAVTGALSGMPEEEGAFDMTFDVRDVAGEYAGRMAPQEVMGSFADSILAGNRTVGSATHGPVTYNVAGDGPDGTFEMATAIASGRFDFAMDKGGLDYSAVSNDMTMTVGGSSIPLPPMTFRMAESGGRLAMPVVPSEEQQNFAVELRLAGLEIDEILWSMIDPAGQIPREPATLVIDLDGVVKLTEDVFDPQFAEEMTAPPGQIDALNINSIRLALAGAELTGEGAFTFDNSAGMPMPAGRLDAMLTGANGLLDTLVGMGLVPEEQAMSARMMLGLFARPGDGPDTLVSTIEVNEDGSVLANGQRIK